MTFDLRYIIKILAKGWVKMRFVIFGAGMNGQRIVESLGIEKVACFVDNNRSEAPEYAGGGTSV